jgi:hypothetical protein
MLVEGLMVAKELGQDSKEIDDSLPAVFDTSGYLFKRA